MNQPLFSQFRAAITDLHETAEKSSSLHRLAKGTISRREYESILKRLYGFIAKVEPMALDAMAPMLSSEESERLSRLQALKSDLLYFKVDIATIKNSPIAAELALPAQALGWFYLSEGSRLGGQVLAKALWDHFEFDHQSGAAYFSSSGNAIHNIHLQWSWFQDLASRILTTIKMQEISIETARLFFEQLNYWLED